MKTVLVIDLLSYSDISRAMENAGGLKATAGLNAEIQSFVDQALAQVGAARAATVAQTTGDGAKLVFADSRAAHDFAAALHAIARAHNATKDHPLGLRVFRAGMATGEVILRDLPAGGWELEGGMTITRAARLEPEASPGGLLADPAAFAGLSPAQQALYRARETVVGKRAETFPAHRVQLDPDGPASAERLKELILPPPAIPRPSHASAPTPANQSPRSGHEGAPPTIWNIPHAPNPNFTEPGRRLSELRAALHAGRPTALTEVALHGLGGVGKTQLAVEYAHRHHADYDLVWWLHAEQPATLAGDFAALAAPLGLPERDAPEQAAAIAAVRAALGRRTRWLLVFDNAETPAALAPYLPRAAGGHVLITSRDPNWGRVAQTLRVEAWSPETAAEFLLKRLPGEDAAAARALAEELGYLPLALAQAAAYVETRGITLAGYRERFRTRQAEMLRLGLLGDEYPAAVATAWDLSFQQLEIESPDGLALLRLCAFLAPEGIPRAMIAAGAEHLPAPLNEAVAEAIAFDDAVAAVRRYSLLECGEGETFSLHRLVQAVVRERLGEAGRRSWAEAAVRVAHKAFPFDDNDHRTWEACASLLPHAAAATGWANKLAAAPKATAWMLNKMGRYAQRRAEYASARTILESALRIGEQVFGPEHPEVATYVNNLGLVLRDLGDPSGAKAAFERALRIDEKVHGPESPKVANRVSNLSLALRELGDLLGARAAFERAMRIGEQVFGSDHPNVATYVNNLGLVLQDLCDLSGARAAFERALMISRRFLGDDHPRTKIAFENLRSLES